MLPKSKISTIKIQTDEWLAARLAKFTSSKASDLISDSTFIRHVRKRVGEEMTGISAEKEVDVDATRHGLLYELDSVRKLAEKLKLDFIIVQQLITAQGSRFGSTPDALIIRRESPDGTEYEAEPVEAKNPPTYDNYLLLWECIKPLDLKKAESKYYWQVLDQMDEAESLIGHFIASHPEFKAGNFRHIEFWAGEAEIIKGKKVFPVNEDLKFLRERKQLALQKFNDLRDRLISEGKF